MKIKIEIKNLYTGIVLFEFEKENNTIKDTLLEAIKKKADLNFADLNSADLRSANLNSANLRFANLNSANLRSADLRFADLRSADLRSADLSFADLRSADLNFAKNLDSDWTDFYWHLHHEILVEWLNEPLRQRINYIKEYKPKDEIELRLKLIKPVLGKIPTTQKGWEKLHNKECGCGWNGKTIFTKKNGGKL